MEQIGWTSIILAVISFLSGLGWMLDRKKHRQEVEALKADNRQKDMNRRTSERRGQAGLDYPEREGGNAKRNLSKDYVTEWRTYIAEPLQREVNELRNEVKELRDAIQRVGDCPHRAQCPVLDSLRKHEGQISQNLNENLAEHEGERFLVYTKDLRKDGATTLLPVMMTMLV